jgi:hypothetical protein
VHLAIDVLAPVLAGGGGEIRLPDITSESFWTQAGVLFLGYLIVIGLFFVVKKLIFKGGGSH